MGKIHLIKQDLVRLMEGQAPAVQWDQTTISQPICLHGPVVQPPPNATPEELEEAEAQRDFFALLPDLPPAPSGEAPRTRLALVRETLYAMKGALGDVGRDTTISHGCHDDPVPDDQLEPQLAAAEAKLAALTPMTRLWG